MQHCGKCCVKQSCKINRRLFSKILLALTITCVAFIAFTKQLLEVAPKKHPHYRNFTSTLLLRNEYCELNLESLEEEIEIDPSKFEYRYEVITRQINNIMNLSSEKYPIIVQPRHCLANKSVAIIVPFRNRTAHLQVLLGHLHQILQKQLINYQVYVVNQAGNETFNKGRLMNQGFLFATNESEKATGKPFDCYIFHDVDLLSISERNFYRCGKTLASGKERVYHMAHSIDKYAYKLCCGITVGGVLGLTKEQFIKINGFSNRYWGWGGEDDDMERRIRTEYEIERLFDKTVRFDMIPHDRDGLNPKNYHAAPMLANSTLWMRRDGVSNIQLQAKILSVVYEPLFVNVTVDVGTEKTR